MPRAWTNSPAHACPVNRSGAEGEIPRTFTERNSNARRVRHHQLSARAHGENGKSSASAPGYEGDTARLMVSDSTNRQCLSAAQYSAVDALIHIRRYI